MLSCLIMDFSTSVDESLSRGRHLTPNLCFSIVPTADTLTAGCLLLLISCGSVVSLEDVFDLLTACVAEFKLSSFHYFLIFKSL